VSEQETRENRSRESGTDELPYVIVTAQKFVALDRGDDANGALGARLGALNTPEAANADRTR
jgi:hypothetical protein